MKTVQISDAAYERLQQMIGMADADTDIPRAFTEQDMVEMALIGLYCVIRAKPETSAADLAKMTVMKFEFERTQR